MSQRFRTAYDCWNEDGEPNFDNSPSLTDTSHQAETNINNIMAKYQKGIPPAMASSVATYGDFAEAPDFLQAQIVVADANQKFAMLPAHVRERFNHDPARFLNFIHDKDNLDEAAQLGLLTDEAKARREAEKQEKANPPPKTPTT